jgi:Asp-tRNA(Asn)/Glu-tRNA(Gln) amidotransferase A subunit family amidase
MQNQDIDRLDEHQLDLNRRHFIGYFSALGLGSTLLPGALTAVAQDAEKITVEMVAAAAKIAGLTLPPETLQNIANQLSSARGSLRTRYENIRAANIPNSLQPALVFNPIPAGMKLPTVRLPLKRSMPKVSLPKTEEELAFLPVTHLSQLIRTRQVTSTQLTRLYLDRLKKYDPVLHCVITLTEELALKLAAQADKEISAGKYKGPLHGIPWGAKDLLAVKGYKTTFGASPYKDQVLDMDATVYTRLTEAGAVLVAKLTLGALAQGDRWFGGMTRSPWDPGNEKTGSSGSSAGPASATAAGLVGFSIGTETRGSIVSPSTRCGVNGLRPTFGRVSRYGAMALSWSMDKIGPLCRSAEDCALVLSAIHGPDGKDNSLIDVPFNWDAAADVKKLRVGYLKSRFEGEIADDPNNPNPQRVEQQRAARKLNDAALAVFRSLGIQLKPIELPVLPDAELGFILSVESAAAFDDITRNNQVESMTKPPESSSWPGTFRLHRFVPAVEYLQANRLRYKMMEDFNKVFAEVDLFLGNSLGVTNLTGHPELCIPHGFNSQGQPTALNITGKLFGEQEILLLAHAFQSKTDHHLRRPKL